MNSQDIQCVCGWISGIFSSINKYDLQSSSATKILSNVAGVSFGVQSPFSLILGLKAKKKKCAFQVSRPYLGFCPDPKYFIVNCEQNVKFAGKRGKMY